MATLLGIDSNRDHYDVSGNHRVCVLLVANLEFCLLPGAHDARDWTGPLHSSTIFTRGLCFLLCARGGSCGLQCRCHSYGV